MSMDPSAKLWEPPVFRDYGDVFEFLRNGEFRPDGLRVEPGLTAAELSEVGSRFGFQFPPDLADFLTLGLPVGGSFPDWRSGNEAELRVQLDWPTEGMLFDVERNDFWLDEWGIRPADAGAALARARASLAAAPPPVLIPICGHRYIPSEPHEVGNPVLSVHQTDIIVYGNDLLDYFNNDVGRRHHGRQPVPELPYWGRLTA